MLAGRVECALLEMHGLMLKILRSRNKITSRYCEISIDGKSRFVTVHRQDTTVKFPTLTF
jgi:hypothetical protein